MESENIILLPTSNASVLSYWQKGQRSGFDLYMGQKLKIHQIWLKWSQIICLIIKYQKLVVTASFMLH